MYIVCDFIRSILDKMCYISLTSHPKWNVDGLLGSLLIAAMYYIHISVIHFLKFISDSFSEEKKHRELLSMRMFVFGFGARARDAVPEND